ncbi:MAG: hypothetical protein HY342_11895 [Candidatus Lambdaproteobacteria bacterium]|nr:hypothetical protein [Candidatus Lambdaproteobacteria bacterium]
MNLLTKFASTLAVSAMVLALVSTLAWGQSMEIKQAKDELARNPSSVPTRLRLIALYNESGIEALKAKKYNDAIGAYMDAMDVVATSNGSVPKNHPYAQEVTYSMAYTHIQLGLDDAAVDELSELVAGDPNNMDARYLLGVTLLRSPAGDNYKKGQEVLRVMALEGKGVDHARATHAAIRFGYNHAVIAHAMGKSQAALDLLAPLFAEYGAEGGANRNENAAVQYAMGIFALDLGNAPGAMASLEGAGVVDSNFKLKNGVKVADVLAGVYYQSGIEFLSKRNEEGGRNALDMFNSAEFMEGKDATDIHHGKALAYYRLNDTNNVSKELSVIAARNPVEFKKIVAQ